MASTRQPPQSLDEWVEFLCDREMPIFSNTAHNIYAILDDSNKGAMELASIILQDPNLTAKLLKLSNSSYYNPSRQKINTISRAIVILGANTIRQLTLACAFFESILSAASKEHANQEIGQAIHAAVQAKQLAVVVDDPSPEEVFIAALLHNIGTIAFWCFDHKQGRRIHELLTAGRHSAAEAEKKVLGFSLRQLSKQLSHAWHLGGLTEQAIGNTDDTNPRLQLVRLGHEISLATSDTDAMQGCLQKLTRLTGLGTGELKTRIEQNTATAVKVAIQFGAHDASRFIANTPAGQTGSPNREENKIDHRRLLIEILQEIGEHLDDSINLNILFEMVLEGIHRGIDMDRTMFMLLSTDKRRLHEKFSFGWHNVPGDKIQIDDDGGSNLLFECIKSGTSVWAKPGRLNHLYSRQIIQFIGRKECFIMPIQTEHKTIGLIWCDRAIRQQPLQQDDYNACKHLVKQANIGLTLFRMRGA